MIAADQGTKQIAATILRHHPVSLFGGHAFLDYTRNTGAAFSFFRTGGALFTVVAAVVSALILLSYRRLAAAPLVTRIALGLVLGGALGNLIDRVRLGYVVDFIDLRWWPVFNLADSAIVIGILLVVLHSLATERGHG